MQRFVALIVFMSVVSACSGSRLPPDATGRQVYGMLCASCHGDELGGRFGPALGPGSDAANMTDDFYRFTIEHGLGRMPSFGSSLTDDQIDRVVAYLREVQAATGGG
ncbi:MAG: cytochrome c [Actinobacteria bacterium]|nr:cytochrome c [Actinomycetota bacterium]